MGNSVNRWFLFLALACIGLCSAREGFSGVISHSVTYHNESGKPVVGYLAEPARDGFFPAVVMVHDWCGANELLRQRADQLASLGCVTLIVDFFDGEEARGENEARRLGRAALQQPNEIFANLRAGVNFLKGKRQVDTSRVAYLGWVYGDRWVYRLAKNELGLRMSIVFHSRYNLNTNLEVMKGSVLGGIAPQNQNLLRDESGLFEIDLITSFGSHRLLIMNNTGQILKLRLDPDQIIDEEASNDAWQRTFQILQEEL